ncbi:LysR family transcriptional regulator [Undibacterium terreum]|uniref:LysR family transcriptional regulator n=1 Tax=Undibacterium terreum TaxID=1224302 RepID=A0A916XCL9_9BURK|nr:LysR family transcriptional regulator [Undibacterium terreum]
MDAAALGSFSAAGRKQGLSPAASSACIQRLEASLKVKLFERTTRNLRLTEEGEVYRLYGQQVLDLMNEADHALQQGKGLVQGTVTISAPSDLGRNLLLDDLHQFRSMHPDVRFVLTLTDGTQNLVQEGIDLAIRYGQPADSSMVARPLFANRRVICAAPACVERYGMPATPQQLAELPTLVLTTAQWTVNEWRYRECGEDGVDGGTKSVRLSNTQQSNDGEVIRKWALQGYGFARKSWLDVGGDVLAGRLVTVLDDFFADSVPLNILYHQNRFQAPRVRLLVEFLQQRFEKRAAELPWPTAR